MRESFDSFADDIYTSKYFAHELVKSTNEASFVGLYNYALILEVLEEYEKALNYYKKV